MTEYPPKPAPKAPKRKRNPISRKKKIGRPASPLTERVRFRATEAEVARYQHKARLDGFSDMSAWIRFTLNRAKCLNIVIDPPLPDTDSDPK